MFVQRKQGAEGVRAELVEQDGGGGMAAGDAAMRVGGDLPLLHGLPLREAVGEQALVVVGEAVARANAGHQIGAEGARALVQQLMESVLAVGLFAAPNHWRGVRARRFAIAPHGFAVALHLQLLQKVRQRAQAVVVG